MEKLDKIFGPKFALSLIILIAAVFRLVPLRYKYLFGYDPYFHLAYIEESLKAGYWLKFITFANGPWGTKISHPLGLYLAPYYVYKVLSVFGVSLYDAFRVTPVIFGVLTIVFFYLAMFNLYGKREAFFSALFLSVMFGHVFRSMANYYRGDNYMLFWYSVALFGVSLALKKTRRAWRYKRFVFYLIPAFASGLAAIFWQAYYPIFAFLLTNAFFITLWAFFSGRQKYFADSIFLAISTAVGVLIAVKLGELYGYGMLWDNWTSRKIAKDLGLTLDNIKDIYLWSHLRVLVPLVLAFILVLFVFSRIKSLKFRLLLLSISILVSVTVFFKFPNRYILLLKEILTGFGIFTNAPILETQKSSFKDLFAAYSIVMFLAPFYLLRFRKPTIADFLNLGLIFPSLIMIYYWTRFLFIGSITVALMGGVGLITLYDTLTTRFEPSRRKMVALGVVFLVLIPIVAGVFGFERAYRERPFMNKHWENALIYLKKNSNENDVVLAWWDYGHWISYYARRAPLAQGTSNAWVAEYFLGRINNNQLMARGVDYIIVSYDTALKFGAILDTAKSEKKGHFLMILPLTSKIGALVFERGEYKILAKPGDKWDILIRSGNAVFSPKEAFLEYRGNITKLGLKEGKVADAYVYLNLNYDYAVLMTGKSFNTILAKLMFTNEYPENYKLVYSDGGYIKIFKFTHPNVEIKKEKSTIRFEVTDEDKEYTLCISGFYENGTRIFEKCVPISKNNAVLLELKIPEVRIIRYTLREKKRALDAGVFRVS
ncbi:STT3 domain-containing protein [Thermococcus paralvinellae]|uniref:dolichyl-phosphooligosaccharide-protein glycotransferase n=1 Tax=Thermococcus paralvinellae TaxID=582419 RepID=W0IA89_9EURY|nr:STT3 domain-containing protein [Thermococcus paralvinellae]AHF81400.1 Oligosaccharyl transferase, STT3 subunit [Thermococcus paralvinellae]